MLKGLLRQWSWESAACAWAFTVAFGTAAGSWRLSAVIMSVVIATLITGMFYLLQFLPWVRR